MNTRRLHLNWVTDFESNVRVSAALGISPGIPAASLTAEKLSPGSADPTRDLLDRAVNGQFRRSVSFLALVLGLFLVLVLFHVSKPFSKTLWT